MTGQVLEKAVEQINLVRCQPAVCCGNCQNSFLDFETSNFKCGIDGSVVMPTLICSDDNFEFREGIPRE